MDPTGATLLWSTFLGGDRWDKGLDVTLDPAGNPIVIGWTQSPNFPVTPEAFDARMNANSKLFITKFDPEGRRLLWSTLLGGSGDESVFRVRQDREGHLVLAGWTQSADFPVTAGAYDTTHGGGRDAFAAKLHRSGGSLIWCTFVGGRIYDYAYDFALDAEENLLLVGATGTRTFPTTEGVYGKTYGGGHHDAFVAKLSGDGSRLLWSTLLGGSASDEGWGIAVNPHGNLVVSGRTSSEDFPVTADVCDGTYNGDGDAFVVEISGDGSALHWATYLGGEGEDRTWTLHLDSAGCPVICGTTFSPDFPTLGDGEDLQGRGEGDAFLSTLDSSGREILWSRVLGGHALEEAFAFSVGPAGDIVLVGETNSREFPVTPGGVDTSYNHGPDSFVIRFRGMP